MKLSTLGVLMVGAMLLGACASTPFGAEGRASWGYVEANPPEGPKLVLGVPDTDDVTVIFFCDPAKDRVNFSIPVAEDSDVAEVSLKSGAVVRRYDTIASPEPQGYPVADFTTDRGDAVLKAFAATGRFAQNPYGDFVSYDARTRSERAAVRDFAKACGLR